MLSINDNRYKNLIMLIKLFAFDIFLYLMIFVIGGNIMNCKCCVDNKHNDLLKVDQRFVYSLFNALGFIKSYYTRATSKITSLGLGSQKGFIANPVHAPPFSNINSLFFCFKNTRCKTLGF